MTSHIALEEAKCPVCCRSFGSMKAMHGHMRCHPERGWRGAKRPVPPPPPPSSPEKSASSSSDSLSHSSTTTSIDTTLPPKKRLYEAEGVALPTSKHAMKAHQCRTCGRSFHTGQALGGHQTTHRPKPPQTARHNANPRVLDFDLNQLPPMQEE